MLGQPQFHSNLFADTTAPRSGAWSEVGILWPELMATFAMGLFRIKSATSIDIGLRRNQFQVFGITAKSKTAKMIDLKTLWDQTIKKLVAKPVDVSVLICDSNHPILVSALPSLFGSHPQPAISSWIYENLVLNSLRQFLKHSHILNLSAP